jgi:hypothetical protein
MHIMEYALPFCPNLPPPSLPRTHTLSTPAVAWYWPARQSKQAVAPEIGTNFPAKHKRIISLRESCTSCV